jgi:hypothetical protein
MTLVSKPGAFLAPVLEGEKAVEEQLGHIDLLPGGDADDPAVMPKPVVTVFHAGMKHERGESVNP